MLIVGFFDPEKAENVLPSGVGLIDLFLLGDILQFAGLALIVIAIFRSLRIGTMATLLSATFVAIAAPFLWGLHSGFQPLDLFLDLLWGDRPLAGMMENAISFPIFPWLAFPLVGMVLGEKLRMSADRQASLRRAGMMGLALLIVGLIITCTNPTWHFNDYYHARWGSMIFLIGFVLAWLAACDIVVRFIPDNVAFSYYCRLFPHGNGNLFYPMDIDKLGNRCIWRKRNGNLGDNSDYRRREHRFIFRFCVDRFKKRCNSWRRQSRLRRRSLNEKA
jgi:hypothetical protein